MIDSGPAPGKKPGAEAACLVVAAQAAYRRWDEGSLGGTKVAKNDGPLATPRRRPAHYVAWRRRHYSADGTALLCTMCAAVQCSVAACCRLGRGLTRVDAKIV